MGRLGLVFLMVLWSWTLVPGAPPVMPIPGIGTPPAGGNVPPGALPPGMVAFPSDGGLRIPGFLVPSHLASPAGRRPDFEGTGTIRGVVMDLDHDVAVPDATVVLLSLQRMPLQRQTGARDRVTTNAKGEFVFERLPPGNYFVEAFHGPGMLVPWHDPGGAASIPVGEGEEVAGLRADVYGGHRVVVRLNGIGLAAEDNSRQPFGLSSMPHDITIARQPLTVDDVRYVFGGGTKFGRAPRRGNELEFRGVFGPSVRMDLAFDRHWLKGPNGERVESIDLELKRGEYDLEVELDLENPPLLQGRVRRANGEAMGPGVVSWQRSRTRMMTAGPHKPVAPVSEEGTFAIEIPGRENGTLEFVLGVEEPIHYGVISFRHSFPEILEVKVPKPGTLKVLVRGENDSPAVGATVRATVELPESRRPGEEPVPKVTFIPHQPEVQVDGNAAMPSDPFGQLLHLTFEAVTDAEGAATFPRLSAGPIAVRAFGAPGSRLAPSEDMKVTMAFGRQSEAEIKLDAYKPFAGVVHDEDGKPISGALVSLGRASNARGQPTESVPESRTDEAGRFRFENVGPRDVREVYVSPPGVQARRTAGKFTPGEENAVITLRTPSVANAGAVRLGVYDQITGESIPHATLLDWQGRPVANFSRSSDGQLEIPGARESPPMEGFMVSAVGYAREAVPFQWGRPISSRVQLVPAATLRGRVIDEASRRPVPEATVEYSLWLSPPFGEPPLPSPFRTKTDSGGNFVLADVPVWIRGERASRNMMETRHLQIEAGPEFAARYLPVTTEDYGLTDLGDVGVNAGLEVAVRVMLAGNPVPGEPVAVSIEPVPSVVSGALNVTREAVTDEEGRVVFDTIPPGRTTVALPARNLSRILMPYEARYPIELQLGRGLVQLTTDAQFGEPRLSLYGDGPERLRLRGRGEGSASPWDPAGVTTGTSLPFGWWRFNVSTSGSDAGRVCVDAELTEEAPELSLTEPFGINTVKVRVEAEEGYRTSSLRVLMEREGEAPGKARLRHEGRTNKDGEATLHRIPAGEYRVVVFPQGNVARWFTANVVVMDTDEEQSVTAKPAEEGGTVVVRAVCAETGAPLEDFSARVTSAPENWAIPPDTRDEDGSVVFTNVPPERLRVSASSSHRLGGEVELAMSREKHREVLLRLEPAGGLRLEIEAILPEDAENMNNWIMDTGIELVRRDAPDRLVDFWMVHPRYTPMNPNRPYAPGTYLVRFLNEGRLVEEREIEIKARQTLVLPVHWGDRRLGVASSGH